MYLPKVIVSIASISFFPWCTIYASRTDDDRLHLGCWDDQFTGTASSNMLINDDKIIISYVAYPPPDEHTIIRNYTSFFNTNNTQVNEQGISFVTGNDPNGFAPGLYSDFDFMIDSEDGELDYIYYCQVSTSWYLVYPMYISDNTR